MKREPLLALLLLSFFVTTSHATVYEMPPDGSAVVGTDTHIKTVYKDTLLDIARRNSLGYYEIIRANPGVDMWLPGEGTDVMLPGRKSLPGSSCLLATAVWKLALANASQFWLTAW